MQSNDSELVSILVPVYNVEQYIGKCLDSLVKQTYTNLQIVVVDDKSTDGSLSICQNYADEDPRLLLLESSSNSGTAKVRKTLVENAKGRYSLMVDGDDYLELNAVELIYAKFRESVADIVDFGHYKVYKDGRKSAYIHKKTPSKTVCGLELFVNTGWSLWSRSYRTEIIQKAYQNIPQIRSNLTRSEDFLAWFFICMESPQIAYLSDALYNYFIRNSHAYSTPVNKAIADSRLVLTMVSNALNQSGLIEQYINQHQAEKHRKLAAVNIAHFNACLNEPNVDRLLNSLKTADIHNDLEGCCYVDQSEVTQVLFDLPSASIQEKIQSTQGVTWLITPIYRIDWLIQCYFRPIKPIVLSFAELFNNRKRQQLIASTILQYRIQNGSIKISSTDDIRLLILLTTLGVNVSIIDSVNLQLNKKHEQHRPFLDQLVKDLINISNT